jgi:periplasmic mercuric ion binding protein
MHKKLFFSFVAMLSFALATNAQNKPAEWITIKSNNLRCWECKERLEKYLIVENKASWESGVIQMRFNLLQNEIRFQYWPSRVTPEDIRAGINNAGFDADKDKAEETAYKKLPPACKRTEDGGGQKKGAPPCHIEPY